MTTTSATETFPIDRDRDGLATLWLEAPHQSVVVFDRIMLDRLNASLDALESDPPAALVIRSRDQRVWVAGADLKEIHGLSDEDLEAYLSDGQVAFGRIASLPFPTIAAITGATLGGGLELALHCHGIVASTVSMRGKPYPIGLPEASLGLVPGWGGTQLLPARVVPDISVAAIATGTPFTSDAMPEGLVDATTETPDEVMTAAATLATSIDPADHPRTIGSCDEDMLLAATDRVRHDPASDEAAGVVAHCIATGVKDGVSEGLEMEIEGLVSLRNTEHTQAQLQRFLAGNA
jgi:3-hydroxyacyl-CoA dehydrogenase/enoyl-CoA hydratase/3-hydroxybutyryl-CoA epimerase